MAKSQRQEPGVQVLGIEAPAPRFALMVVWSVIAAFLTMQIVDILEQAVDAVTITCCLTVLPATVGLQLVHTLPRCRRVRAAYGRWTLLAQTLLTVVPALFLGWPWGGMGGFVGASMLLLLPLRAALPAFGCLTAAIGLGTAMQAHSSMGNVLYMVVSTLVTGVIVHSLTLLANLTLAVHEAKEDFARVAVIKERLRFARDLHDLLGYSLSAITLKSELAHAVTGHAPDRARAELESIVELSRQALRDVREVARSYRSMSLLTELSSARSVLSAAGIDAHLRVECGRLPADADTVLATVLREGITNVIQHSKASRCTIEAVARDGTTSLRLANDGVPARVKDDNRLEGCRPDDEDAPNRLVRGNGGLNNLTARLASVGGTLSAGVREDGWFVMEAEISAPAQDAATLTTAQEDRVA
ncbi:sensor histidine kinase [Kitasatospora kifunensis]|uniref:Two-component system sensor histidine kinase DesK n=1 Tax=Kitasatospora kifunensis TaxID=58351 RepID=A0A7W7VVX2_KITKI|nr:histidine kinase [Kitasatospora kifunensis]MBB4924852.1 two-component system sensor histidine kinase DesK [Kitasatospora kifunensis]